MMMTILLGRRHHEGLQPGDLSPAARTNPANANPNDEERDEGSAGPEDSPPWLRWNPVT
jgi:hypothetical protein